MRILSLLLLACYVTTSLANDGPNMVGKSQHSHLPRLDPVKVGFSRSFYLFEGHQHKTKIITLSTKPPVFEIPNFFTKAECDHLLSYSERVGYKVSPQIIVDGKIDEETSETSFRHWDYDKDGFISPQEIEALPGKSDLYFLRDDVLKMFDDLEMDTDHDGVISYEEFNKTTVPTILAYFDKLREIPRMRSRNSKQAWMFHDNPKYPLLADFHGRIKRLTGLPKHIIQHSEPVQVVKYDVSGHYHAHHDSDELSDRPCCTLKREEDCRLCRYITVLVFMNEPEEGGETAFPFAMNQTFTTEGLTQEGYKVNLGRHCKDSNLIVKPRKGKAIMWYNHHRDKRSGWLGKLDKTTLHGGCDVTKGNKWIINLWLNVIGEPGSEDSYKGWLHGGEEIDSKDVKDEL